MNENKYIKCYFCDEKIKYKESHKSYFVDGRICKNCNEIIEIPLRFLNYESEKNIKELIDLKNNFNNSIIKFFKENKGQLSEKKYKEFLNKLYNKDNDKDK